LVLSMDVVTGGHGDAAVAVRGRLRLGGSILLQSFQPLISRGLLLGHALFVLVREFLRSKALRVCEITEF
ncbi:MAG: hypothetical protein MK441_09420, partial [SAR324 cluster bacterium]|nr:hypothetical protein [SAR324 cluster bacterium]